MSLRTTIITSLVVAVLACVIPYGLMQSLQYGFPGSRYTFHVAATLSMAWLSLAVYAVAEFRSRGLWVLVGAVPALLWMYSLAAITLACAVYHDCL